MFTLFTCLNDLLRIKIAGWIPWLHDSPCHSVWHPPIGHSPVSLSQGLIKQLHLEEQLFPKYQSSHTKKQVEYRKQHATTFFQMTLLIFLFFLFLSFVFYVKHLQRLQVFITLCTLYNRNYNLLHIVYWVCGCYSIDWYCTERMLITLFNPI